MKKYIYLAIIALVSTSCEDFLYRPPMDAISSGSYWNDEADLKGGINNLYNFMNHTWNEDVQSIDVYSGSLNNISSGTYTTPETDAVWSSSYEGIYYVHEFLDNYKSASLASDEVKARYRGEALYFRALLHFNLVKRFGDTVIVTSKLGLSSPELYGTRDDRTEVIDFILEDLEEAIELLPTQSWIISNNDDEDGRISQGAALALSARIALYEGTHCKFHGHDSDKVEGYLTTARNNALALINSGEYSLEVDNLKDLFGPKGEGSSEVILAYRYDESQGSANSRHSTIANGNGFMPTKYLVDAFLCTDGLPIETSPLFMGRETITSEFENRDPRMANTIWTPLTEHPNLTEPYVPNLSTSYVGYLFYKGMDDSLISSGGSSYTDEILFRLTEAYLIYAEASYELNDAISDTELDASINILRDRVGMPSLTNSFVATNSLNMQEEIRRERRIELASEGFRYDDIIRWKTAEDELILPVLGSQYYAEYYVSEETGEDYLSGESLNDENYIVVQSESGRYFVDPKNYLFPIPTYELGLNANLGQNEGW
ncbi:MAG: RagB/SusD family nutrient uptake outer membrane protein [Rikenellaceae bacterium]